MLQRLLVYSLNVDTCKNKNIFFQKKGGFKQSGIGREQSEYGLSNYLEVKCVTTKISNSIY